MAVIGNSSTQQAFTPAVDYFSGNASTTAFTLSRPVASVAQVQVVVNNVAQNPSSAYTVSSNTITFTSAPSSGTNNIYVYYTSPITQVIAPSQGSVNTTSLGNITNIASGNSSLTLQTGTSPTTAVTIDTSQNVGIGTTSPSGKFHVSGGRSYFTANSEQFDIALKYNIGTSGVWLGSPGTDSFAVATEGGTERMRIDSSGNVGIGSSTITSADGAAGRIFKVSGSTNTVWVGETTGNGGYNGFIFEARNSNRSNPRFAQVQMQTVSTATDGGLIIFSTSATGSGTDISERMRVNQNGSVYVGNQNYGISPSNANYGFGIEANGGNPFINHCATTGTGLTTYYAFINGNGAVGTIKTTGSSTQFNTSSDVRLKKNIVDAPSAIASIQQIGIKSFDWKADDLHQEYGVIAQELDAIAPEAVSHGGAESEMWGVDYSKLVPRMIKAIQELKAINDTQAETINALTARIEALENK